MKTPLNRTASWLITLIVPFVLIMISIRVLFTPLFPQVIYRIPGFPPDTYGFSLDDRLHWSRVSLEYLWNNAGIEYLADQQLPDGQPLYNERELSHMLDVKLVLRGMVTAMTILLLVLTVLLVWAWRANWLREYISGLGRGGKLTIGLVVMILLAVAVSFNALFTAFHRIFFSGNSWLFNYSDTLIRLFPLPLWMYGFILMGVLTLLGAVILIWLERRFS